MRIIHLSVDDALASLHSARDGLSSAEAARRLAEYGLNRVEEIAREPLWLRCARQFTHFFALILLLAAGLAFIAERYDPGQGMAALGWAIIGVVVLNGAFGFWQEYRAERAVEALKALLPHQATVRRDGVAVRLGTEVLVPGDVIVLAEGDDVPADCRLIEAQGVRVSTATVTGESLPRVRTADPVVTDDLLESRNVLLAGTSLVSGDGTALVFATGMRTEFGKIAHLTQTAGEVPSPLQQEIARLSRLIALLATVLGVVFFFFGQALGLDFWANFLFAIGIIVANVPEGLLPTVTLALAMATQRMAKRNALIRHLPAAEALGSATVIVTDKTGTLTENRMIAVRAHFAGAECDLAPPRSAEAAGREPFFEIARHCHSLREIERGGGRALLGDPMEVALYEMAERALGAHVRAPLRDELPFDADRKRMSTVHDGPDGRVLYCKGALEQVLPLCTHVLLPDAARGAQASGTGSVVPMTETLAQEFLAAQERMAEQGLRVLALAYRTLPAEVPQSRWEKSLVLAGIVGLHDPPRAEVPQAVAACRTAGIRVIMVTCDHPHTAQAVARQTGLAAAPAVITGATLSRLTDTQLQLALDTREILFARVTADQKLRIVEALQRKGHVVAVTGDGVNDAPALKRADIGVAMGITGTDVAKEAASMILLDDNFATIVRAVREGRKLYDNVRKFIRYMLTTNSGEVWTIFLAPFLGLPIPLLPIQILWINLVTDGLPGLALAGEPDEPDVMRRPPRPPTEGVFAHGLSVHAVWVGLLMAALTLGTQAWFFHAGSPRWQTMTFTVLCLAQLAHVLAIRSERQSLFTHGLRSNTPLLGAVILTVLLQLAAVYAPFLNGIFWTEALAPGELAVCVAAASAVFFAVEGEKWLKRRLAPSANFASRLAGRG
jgi:sodium/potassium-transporting ATPase subunit alpha